MYVELNWFSSSNSSTMLSTLLCFSSSYRKFNESSTSDFYNIRTHTYVNALRRTHLLQVCGRPAERLLVPGPPQLAQALVVLLRVVVLREQNLREDLPSARIERVAQVQLHPVAELVHLGLRYFGSAEQHRPHPGGFLREHRETGLQVRVDRAQLLVNGPQVLEGEESGPAAVLPAQELQFLQVQAVRRGGREVPS
ncbi:hypothetical protein EYF80_039798 [Liparis tanakae]|uniref:Uncharacterized protein n=1 Tax=Liparis tanakae TaxID=230148 RepID=A0A4Z2G9V8_9TELE|nr:hypothetical protein EYF80_039798 [Liparis tanakae]